MTLPLLFLILAFISFCLEAVKVSLNVNFIAIGLALWSLSIISASL